MTVTKVRRWLRRSGAAMIDQGSFAASSFALNVLLARWLAPGDYGAFVTAYATLTLLGTIHTAFVTDPLLLLGPGKYRTVLGVYWPAVVRGHWLLSVTLSVALLVVLVALRWLVGVDVHPVLLALALAAPFVLHQWLARRGCYVVSRPDVAAQGGVLYLVLLLGGAYALQLTGWLAPTTALAALAVASMGSVRWILLRLRLPRSSDPAARATWSGVVADHWGYGRWATLSLPLGWLRRDGYVVIVSALAGLEAAGTLRAVLNLLMPLVHGGTALAAVALPALARMAGGHAFERGARIAMLLAGSLGVLYGLLTFSFGAQLLSWLYAGRYDAGMGMLVAFSLMAVAIAVVRALDTILKARNEVRMVFVGSLVAALTLAVIGVPAIVRWQITGAAGSMAVSYYAAAVSLWTLDAVARRRSTLRGRAVA